MISNVSEEEDQEVEYVDDDDGKSESPTTFLSAVERISTARKITHELACREEDDACRQ